MKIGVRNDWLLIADAYFDEQLARLEDLVESKKIKDPENFKNSNAAKRLRALDRLVTEVIPGNPAAIEFRIGNTLGKEFRHWRRAKFLERYRLFFRYDSTAKIIIYSWFNDDETLRAYGSKSDAYKIFGRMLANGNPPNDWLSLLDAAGPDF